MDEQDIREAIRDNLVATGAFDAVWATGLPEAYGQGASSLAAAAIEPGATRYSTGWDAAPSGQLAYTAAIKVTLLVRHADPEAGDRQAEALKGYLINAVNGQPLIPGFTSPQKTLVQGWTWKPREHPERRIESTVSVEYVLPWQGTLPPIG